MKAAILEEPGTFFIRELPVPECPEGGLLVKVKAAAICSADVNMIMKGHKALTYPRIPGHEMSGIIWESRSRLFKEGENVQIAPGIACGKCQWCIAGMDNHCENIKIFGFNMDGGFSEYIIIPLEGVAANIVNPFPKNISFQEAALTEPLACCINGQETIEIKAGDKVLIIGAGPIGCLHALLARLNGADKVIIADFHQERVKSAVETGADCLIELNSDEPEMSMKKVLEVTKGNKVDAIIIACSTEISWYDLVDLLAPRGRICLFSSFSREQKLFDQKVLNQLHYKEAVLAGAYGNTSKQNRIALNLIAQAKIKVNWLITKQILPEEIYMGIELSKNKSGLKTIINY
ncbi:MAG: alcohol dehydrogenase catalytic domain-containing protein [Candidatus Humimicrobiaceae bacterium]